MLGVKVAVVDAGRVLLTLREDFEVWCLPGGQVEAGESLAGVGRREHARRPASTCGSRDGSPLSRSAFFAAHIAGPNASCEAAELLAGDGDGWGRAQALSAFGFFGVDGEILTTRYVIVAESARIETT